MCGLLVKTELRERARVGVRPIQRLSMTHASSLCMASLGAPPCARLSPFRHDCSHTFRALAHPEPTAHSGRVTSSWTCLFLKRNFRNSVKQKSLFFAFFDQGLDNKVVRVLLESS